MSYSVSNLFQSLGLNGNPEQQSEDKLFNPDIPMPSQDFKQIKNIRDQSFKSMKLPETNSRAYNGSTFRLPRNILFKDPRMDNFYTDGSIDPNNIRALRTPPRQFQTSGRTPIVILVSAKVKKRRTIMLILLEVPDVIMYLIRIVLNSPILVY
jgi:hypothetical protein